MKLLFPLVCVISFFIQSTAWSKESTNRYEAVLATLSASLQEIDLSISISSVKSLQLEHQNALAECQQADQAVKSFKDATERWNKMASEIGNAKKANYIEKFRNLQNLYEKSFAKLEDCKSSHSKNLKRLPISPGAEATHD